MLFHEVFEDLFTIWSSIAAGVFVLVVGIMLVAIVRNRASRRSTYPFQASEHNPLELSYVVLLALIVGGLVFGSFYANSLLNQGTGVPEAGATTPAAQINVTAFRWCWDFEYQNAPIEVTGECTPGEYPTIVVPAGEVVKFTITSDDVIHAFWLPDFAAKRDAFPDHVNVLRIVFPEGRWRGRCSEFCGTHHWTMDFYVRAVPPEQFQQYLSSGGTTA